MSQSDLIVRGVTPEDQDGVLELVTRYFGSSQVVSRGKLHQCDRLPGLVALYDSRLVGLLQYDRQGRDLEIVTLVSEQRGAGRQLLERAVTDARDLGMDRCWLITTNNNHNAINFYRHVGWSLKATHRGAVSDSRILKPEIPLHDDRGVPIEDELEFERRL